MDPILSYVNSREAEMTALIREFVECESPSDDAVAVNRFVELLSDTITPLARIRRHPGGSFGKHLTCEMRLPGRMKSGRVLALGHSDTVWSLGTLRSMPYRKSAGRIYGPGVYDMKAGIVFFLFAVRALRELEIPVPSHVMLQLNSDEEVGSESSRGLTEQHARQSKAVLVLEPGTGRTGKVKTARKGVGGFTVVVRGRASHAGLDYEAGASAVLELAHQITRISGLTHFRKGITVNPGVISGGTRCNVVAAEARAEIDIRVRRQRDAILLERQFRALRPLDKRCTIEISGGLNRPPMERSAGGVRLFRTARKLAKELGIELEESMSGGGSDGNFTAALGVPTLDGLGAVGEGAHAINENILIDRMADRTALLAKLMAAL